MKRINKRKKDKTGGGTKTSKPQQVNLFSFGNRRQGNKSDGDEEAERAKILESVNGSRDLNRTKQLFGDSKFKVNEYITYLFSKIEPKDAEYFVNELEQRKQNTSDHLSSEVVRKYEDFIKMSRLALEIEDQMIEMNDMLKYMSHNIKTLHGTSFDIIQVLNENNLKLAENEQKRLDRQEQALEALDTINEQISQHIQLRQLQQAIDLIIDAKRQFGKPTQQAQLLRRASAVVLNNNKDNMAGGGDADVAGASGDNENDDDGNNMGTKSRRSRRNSNAGIATTAAVASAAAQAQQQTMIAANNELILNNSESLSFIDDHIATIHTLIVEQLTSQSYLPDVKRDRLSALLMRLGYVDESMSLFLQHKSEQLKQLIRNISLYGDVGQFIRDLSNVFFDHIITATFKYSALLRQIKDNPSIHSMKKHDKTQKKIGNNNNNNEVKTDNNNNKDNDDYKGTGARGSEKDDNDEMSDISSGYGSDDLRMDLNPANILDNKQLGEEDNSIHMSRLMVWVCQELLIFEKLFEQQVFKIEHNAIEVIGECLKIVFKKCNRLEQSGINLSFILTMQFKPSVEQAIIRLFQRKFNHVRRVMSKESYISSVKALGKRATNRGQQTARSLSRRLSSQNLLSHATLKDQVNKSDGGVTTSLAATAIQKQVSTTEPPTLEIGTEYRLDRAPSTIFDVMSPNGSASATPAHGIKNPMWASGSSGMASPRMDARKLSQSVSKAQIISTVHLTKSGIDFYDIVKKCIQQLVRLLDNKLYVDLTKSVYPLVVASMQELMIAYKDQIMIEIHDLAPQAQLLSSSSGRRASVASPTSDSSSSRRRSSSSGNKHGQLTRTLSHQVVPGQKGLPSVAEDEKYNDGGSITTRLSTLEENPNSVTILNEEQTLSMIANIYYVCEDLLERVTQRFQILFVRDIPELESTQSRLRKTYESQYEQFGKRFCYTWVNDILGFENGYVSLSNYCTNDNSSAIEDISVMKVSTNWLNLVKYFVELRIKINKHLAKSPCDRNILTKCFYILFKELYFGEYVPLMNNSHKRRSSQSRKDHHSHDGGNAGAMDPFMEERNRLRKNHPITEFGIQQLYLDIQFFVTCFGQFIENEQSTTTLIKEFFNNMINFCQINYQNEKIMLNETLFQNHCNKLQYTMLKPEELDLLKKYELPASIFTAKSTNIRATGGGGGGGAAATTTTTKHASHNNISNNSANKPNVVVG